MIKKLLIGLLSLALIIEIVLCIGAFFMQEKILTQFGVGYNNDTVFLGYFIAWFLLLVSILIGIALWQVLKNKPYQTICYLLATWWIALGIGVYIVFHKTDNLFLDSIKGVLLFICTWQASKKENV